MALQFTYFCNAHYIKKLLYRYLDIDIEICITTQLIFSVVVQRAEADYKAVLVLK